MTPPRHMPTALRDQYTMGGRVPVRELYYDSTYASDTPLIYTVGTVDTYIAKARAGVNFYYKKTDACLYRALKRYAIGGQDVAVMGSTDPWYEAVTLAYGGRPTTIEYNTIVSQDPRLRALTVAEYEKMPRPFDAALAISSLEHDGLGRYGDLLDPDGDRKAMAKMKSVVKTGGLLFLAVPIGHDAVVWNAHRIYGHIRLPRLLAGWKIIAFFGVRPGYFQPVVVLKNDDSPPTALDRWRSARFFASVRYMERAERFVTMVTRALHAVIGHDATYKLKVFIHSRL